MTDPPGPRGGRPVVAPPWETALEDIERSGEPELVITPDAEALASAAVERLAAELAAALERRGRADVALTGGSTPRAMYRRLIQTGASERIDWARVHLWWGDDRYVPRADRLANLYPADETLLSPGGVPVPRENVHPFPTDRAIQEGLGPAWCAATYAAEVIDAVPSAFGWPSFDLVLVGIGGDGHLLSVFPGSPALGSDRVGLAIPAPGHIEPHVERVTLNPAILVAAGAVIAMATGGGKSAVITRILTGPRDPVALPAVLARRASATWLLDADAAAGLGRLEDGQRMGHPPAG